MIYKYLTTTGLLRILNSKRIRFTQAAALNDPFECNPCFDVFKKSLRERAERLLKDKGSAFTPRAYMLGGYKIHDMVEDHMREFIDDLRSQHLMLCLTTERNNLLMWAHYSDSHGGCVIGFDDRHPFFNREKPSPITKLMNVRYADERFILPTFDECMADTSVHENILLLKSRCWEYEQERRMFAKPSAANDRGRDGQGLPMYLFDLPSECVTEIIFGHKVSREDRRRVGDLVKSTYQRAALSETRPNSSRFDIDITPLK
jgi:hypothetical protein